MFDSEFPSLEQPNEALSPKSQGSRASSPVPSSYTSEQRELKRQHDRARRDSRLSARMRRYSSTSYGEQSPMGSVDTVSNMGISGYSSAAPDTMSILGEPPSSMAPSSYATQYSPAMSEQPVPGQNYHMSYQQPLYVDIIHLLAYSFKLIFTKRRPQNYNIPIDYQTYISPGAFRFV